MTEESASSEATRVHVPRHVGTEAAESARSGAAVRDASEVEVLAARVETFQATAADLVCVDDVASVLAASPARRPRRARPRHLLAVQTTRRVVAIHHRGFRARGRHSAWRRS